MSDSRFNHSLDSLLDLSDTAPAWSESDLAAVLRHQLSTPLEPDGRPIGQILSDPGASIESLQEIKRHAKVRRSQGGAGVPQDLWRVIYFASIAAASRRGQSISDLSPAELSQGFKWTLARPWVEEPIRQLINAAMVLSAHEP